MARRKQILPLFEDIEVTDLAAEGKALARIENFVVFIRDAVPGDVVDIQVTRKKHNFMEAIPVTYKRLSSERIQPVCSHFGVCGGCKWQQLNYQKQLYYKEKQVRDNFERLGKLSISEFRPILASERTERYRNKLEFTFSDKRWLTREEMGFPQEGLMNGLGFHVPGKFDKVLDIDTCYLQPEPSNAIRKATRAFAIENEYSFFDLQQQQGFLRNLIIRTNEAGEVMVIVVFFSDDREPRERLLDHLRQSFPHIHSLMYVINGKANDTLTGLTVMPYYGESFLTEQLENLQCRISPKSFFQTNTRQGLRLYQLTREFAALTGTETVYDLYTGTGTIALFIAGQARKVVGIEYVEEAIIDARLNATLNQINNVEFVTGDMKDIFTESFIQSHGRPDVIILDPPRAGVHEKVIEGILHAPPQRIVYVSCNPATQARDISLLKEHYEVAIVQPVDMFPHTQHVENIALLLRKQDSEQW